MKFRIGPWVYKVRIAESKLFDGDGHAANGLCVFNDRTIWICPELQLGCRLETLKHELWHAWCRHFGTPHSEEDLCNAVSTFATDIHRQLERLGGESALIHLTTQGLVDYTQGPEESPAQANGAQCPCGSMVGAFSVVTSPPEFSPLAGRLCVRRTFYCDDCGRVVTWLEGATSAGHPNGLVITRPSAIVGQARQDWLNANRDAAGVYVRDD